MCSIVAPGTVLQEAGTRRSVWSPSRLASAHGCESTNTWPARVAGVLLRTSEREVHYGRGSLAWSALVTEH
jgi:hypothetical protein